MLWSSTSGFVGEKMSWPKYLSFSYSCVYSTANPKDKKHGSSTHTTASTNKNPKITSCPSKEIR